MGIKLDPQHLAQLSVLVEAGSFQAAADRLGLIQPALSRNMKALEQRLGQTCSIATDENRCQMHWFSDWRTMDRPFGWRKNKLAFWRISLPREPWENSGLGCHPSLPAGF
ncbi:LysR family transcriptional regulator [Actibacterium sp. 188UL27-1]|uniref:helix-turn-helix domain-containing protein n=1 Tax=Actibacterium sp. 188UL27-1 TaxID=2786961 RepID=UPI00195C9BDD|nr:LysR family transcriptional regulator [Actibacterium sp. 188UL27-1]